MTQKFVPGARVQAATQGSVAGKFGTIANLQNRPTKLRIRWDGNVLPTDHDLDGIVVEGLRLTGVATTTTVAQAISFAIDEAQEFGGHNDHRPGLYLSAVEDESDLRVTEVSAELRSHEGDERSLGYPYSTFTISTSDGQVWEVRVRAVR